MKLKMAHDQKIKIKKKFEEICVLNTFDNNEINDYQTNT